MEMEHEKGLLINWSRTFGVGSVITLNVKQLSMKHFHKLYVNELFALIVQQCSKLYNKDKTKQKRYLIRSTNKRLVLLKKVLSQPEVITIDTLAYVKAVVFIYSSHITLLI